MSSDFSSRIFLLTLLLSPLTIAGSFQNVFAANLTPVADLTGQWSGFAQITIPGGYCEYTGNVNAYLKQDGNNIAGEFSWVATSSKSSNPDVYECDYRGQTYSDNVQGTISGSQITLQSSEASFTGWYASSGISLDIVFGDESIGITQLSPTGFSPPPFESEEAQDTDGDGISDDVDECIGLLEDYSGENDEDGCPEKDSDDDTFYDYEDSCPYDPEDFLGIEDGCPEEEEDTDGDSFYDNEDVCPYDAEDYFKFGELEGCPETDADNDNIYDSIDQCIYEPEDTVGDTDGCPDEDNSIVDQDEFVEGEDEFVEDEFAEDEFAEEEFPEAGEAPNIIFPTRLPDNFFRDNGCGPQGGGIDIVPDTDVAESCKQHDICYGRGGDAEDRKICDEEFYESIKSNSILGKYGAKLYYWGVRLGGTSSFNCVTDSCR